uniref:Uncharacterized protein n=1 Tax=Parascaris equorum TaxID=6256 RepID=A0A914RVB6_PAREQ
MDEFSTGLVEMIFAETFAFYKEKVVIFPFIFQDTSYLCGHKTQANWLQTKDKELRTIFGLRDNFHDTIWNLTVASDSLISHESFNSIGQEYFEALVTSMFDAYRNQFINERHLLNRTKGDEMLWTYANSIFFATTVITTIGEFALHLFFA